MAEIPCAALLRPELAELTAYLPDLTEYAVRLDANEAPPLLSADARARIAATVADTRWERYPDPTASELRAALAARSGVGAAEVLAGAGSDELITLLLTALSRPRERSDAAVVLTTTPTFVMYRLAARARGLRVLEVPLDADWDLALDATRRGAELAPPNLVFIASPNNPTGNLVTRERLEALIRALPDSFIVIDEAYIDYAREDQLELYRRCENVGILRTLSKIGFASLRVGWLVARAPLIAEIDKLRPPYNLCTLSQRLGTLVTRELAPEIAQVTALVKSERARVAGELAALPGFQVTPSEANFLWLKTPGPAAELFAALARRGVLVRSFHQRGGRLAQQLRVTIGAPHENDRFLECLRELT